MFESITKWSGEDMQKCMYKYGSLLLSILLTIMIIYFAIKDPNAQTTRYYMYSFLIIVPFLLVYYYALLDDSYVTYFSAAFFLFLFMTIIYYYSSMSSGTTQTIAYLLNLLFVVIIIVALSGVAYVYSNYLKSLNGWIGFFTNFVFYIPCLFLEFFMYIREEFRLTSNVIFYIFILELLLILFYIYLPSLLSTMIEKSSIPLLKDSAYLDIQQTIATSEDLKNKNPPAGVVQPSYYNNYGLSMWIYLNDQPSNYSGYEEESEIFNYSCGKPRITYFNNIHQEEGKDNLNIYFTNITSSDPKKSPSPKKDSPKYINNLFQTRIQKQKWNHFVFNYTSTYADLFINGVLVKTFPFQNNSPTFTPRDFVSIGKNKGLDGAICNIHFYKNNLTLPEIVNSYNLLVNKNPPTNNL